MFDGLEWRVRMPDMTDHRRGWVTLTVGRPVGGLIVQQGQLGLNSFTMENQDNRLNELVRFRGECGRPSLSFTAFVPLPRVFRSYNQC